MLFAKSQTIPSDGHHRGVVKQPIDEAMKDGEQSESRMSSADLFLSFLSRPVSTVSSARVINRKLTVGA